jgi:hypothetical protein
MQATYPHNASSDGSNKMSLSWTESTKLALLNYSARNHTVIIPRQRFIEQELGNIVQSTASQGKTPSQTLSRVLQELRDANFLYFSKQVGEYTLVQSIDVSREDLPDDVIENAIIQNALVLDDVTTGDQIKLTRLRKGTAKLRDLTLMNYQTRCALCDISDPKLLVTSHVVPWAIAPLIRGHLDNVICFCTLHDKLFETGYFSLNDDRTLLWQQSIASRALQTWQTNCTDFFNHKVLKAPNSAYLAQHRVSHGFYLTTASKTS